MKPFQLTLVKWSYLVFFVIMIVANILLQEQVSALAQVNKPLIQPAGYTFSIWSVIYGWFLCWILYSFFRSHERDELYSSLKYLLPTSFSLNTLWLIAYTSKQSLLAVLFLFLLLAVNVLLYIKVRPYRALGWFNVSIFSMYLGWVSTAAVVNLFSFINNLTPTPWTMIEQAVLTALALLILFLLALYSLFRWQDRVLPLTLAWAFTGIAFNHMNTWLSVISLAFVVFIIIFIIIVSIQKK